MTSLIPEVLKLIGLSVNEEFRFKDNPDFVYKIVENGSSYLKYQDRSWSYDGSCALRRALSGEGEIEKLPFKPKCNERYYNVASISISCM